MLMIALLVCTVIAGVFTGLFLDDLICPLQIDFANEYLLYLLVFIVGVDLGRNKEAWLTIMDMGIKILLAPLLVIFGTLTGALVASLFLDISTAQTLAISAGFGWYSMSAVLLRTLDSTEIGAIAFLANLFRELLTIFFLPLIVRQFGRFPAMAPGGATSMDTTLPFVSRYAGKDVALIGFVSGVSLTLVSPFLISLLITMNI